jgi:membrane-bound ClpP family serine protease
MMSNLLNKYLNLSDRENKLFGIGLCLGISLVIFFSSLFCCCIFKFDTKSIINKIIDIKRSKILNGNRNIFYFDENISEKSLTKFKHFINELTGIETIDIILSTNGGNFSIAQIIVDILLKWKGETNAIILDKAFSAGTLIALSCKNIYMSPYAYFSPVDVIHNTFFDSTQLTSISTVIANKDRNKISDATYILSDQAKKCKLILDNYFERISSLHQLNNNEKIYEEIFKGEKYIHCTTFSKESLIDMGLNIKPITKNQISLAKLIKTISSKY